MKMRITEIKHNFQGPSAKGQGGKVGSEPGISDYAISSVVHKELFSCEIIVSQEFGLAVNLERWVETVQREEVNILCRNKVCVGRKRLER